MRGVLKVTFLFYVARHEDYVAKSEYIFSASMKNTFILKTRNMYNVFLYTDWYPRAPKNEVL